MWAERKNKRKVSGNYLLNWWVELKVEGHSRVCVVYLLLLKHYICKETQLRIDPRVWTQLINVADNSAILQSKRKKKILLHDFAYFFQIFYVLSMNMKKLICAKGKSKLLSITKFRNIIGTFYISSRNSGTPTRWVRWF